MANITSIGGNPIVPAAVQSNSVTDAMLVQTGGVLSRVGSVVVPTVTRNGSAGNAGNANAIAISTPVSVTTPYYRVAVDVELQSGYEFYWVVRYNDSSESYYVTETQYVVFDVDTNTYTTIQPCVFMRSKSNQSTYYPLRVANLGTDALHVIPIHIPSAFEPTKTNPLVRDGSLGNAGNANAVAMRYVQPIGSAESVRVKTSVQIAEGQEYWWVVQTYTAFGQATNNTALTYYDPYYHGSSDEIEIVNDGSFVGFGTALFVKDSSNNYVPQRIATVGNCFTCEFFNVSDHARDALMDVLRPPLNDGTILNDNNANCVAMPVSVSTRGADAVLLTYEGELADGQTVSWMPITCLSAGLNRMGMKTASNQVRRYDGTVASGLLLGKEYLLKLHEGEDAIGVALGIAMEDDPTTHVSGGLRISKDQFCMTMRFLYGVGQSDEDVTAMLRNARHVSHPYGTTVAPALTLLHFSDLHSDQTAMKRIMAGYDSTLMEDAICTGDLVGNVAGQISSWWDESVMTCVGNHDSASYSASTGYDWTALSMADRDAYYIAPFESNWGITHTLGTSYYYKDYASSKVRLIVMDGMLYMSSSYATEAATQTSWLTSLLSGAITAGLHVLIAIHAPHGGAVAKPCGFTRLNQSAMPTNTDCDTPQTVIDTVATAIGNGLDFIGYIVGHTHQDNIWDATGDGSQLMYCVTCASVAQTAQWQNSDQSRDSAMDAYNLVTIDTNNKLVKIVRGGGADVDDKMRPRRMLCVSYDTGTIVGQEL